jgi:hypothetical protein
MVDLHDRSDTLIEGLCKGQLLCKTIGQRTFNNYLSANHNKAMAIGWGKTGYGVRWGADDPGLAMLGALYHCNHAKNNPKLCRLVSVNEHEVLPLYDEASTQAAAFLGQLQTPSPERTQAEREEPGARTPSKLRWGHALTGMTPKALEGIQRWDTATLVQALQQPGRPAALWPDTRRPPISASTPNSCPAAPAGARRRRVFSGRCIWPRSARFSWRVPSPPVRSR